MFDELKHFTGTLNKWSKINNLKYEDSTVFLEGKKDLKLLREGKNKYHYFFNIKKGRNGNFQNKAPLQIKTMDSSAPV